MEPDSAFPFYEVHVEDGLLIVVRTHRRYESIDEVPASFEALRRTIADAGPHRVAILDLRLAMGRNDEQFEETLAPERRALLGQLSRIVFLVKTNIGRMQIERYLQRDGVNAPVCTSMEEALIAARRLDAASDGETTNG